SRRVEYMYYFSFLYSMVSGYLGIEIPLFAAGLIVALGGLCLIKLGSRRKEICAPIALLLATQFSYIFVQIAVYDVSVTDDSIRTFILWMFLLIIVQSLCLRPGFLHRCTIVMFVLGLIVIPHLAFKESDNASRAAVAIQIGGYLTNANGLGLWFGFCVVVFSIAVLETRRGNIVWILFGLAAIGCLLIVGFTVSRGALLGCALALTVGFRRFLKRGFLPVLLLIILGGVALASGLFDQMISNYEQRGTEETGRFLLWPLIIGR